MKIEDFKKLAVGDIIYHARDGGSSYTIVGNHEGNIIGVRHIVIPEEAAETWEILSKVIDRDSAQRAEKRN